MDNTKDIFKKVIEDVKREAFMEGYAYVIRVLQEGISQKKKQSDDEN